MANKVSINVELKTKIQDQVKNLQSQASGLKLTPKDTAYIQEAIQDINRFLSKDNLQIKDINEAISALNKLNGHINKLHLESSSASDAVKKYNEQLKNLEKAEQKAQKDLAAKEDQAGKYHSDKGVYSDVALRKMDVKKIFEGYQTSAPDDYKIKGVRGDKPITFETFWKHYKEDPSKIKNLDTAASGQDSLLTQIKTAETDLTNELNKLAQAVIQARTELETHKTNIPKEFTENPTVANNLKQNDTLKQELGEVADGLRKTKDDGDSLSATSVELNKNIEKQTAGLGKVFKHFTLYRLALGFTKKAVREAVSTVKELDKELTEQAMVTGMTRKETYGLMKTYQELALATGATTKEVASVATEYIKQGKSIKEATLLTEAAVSAAKVARVSTADSVNYLTTALNGFQLSANDAMKVSDKFAAVAAASATDYDELAIALSKVASQANLAGMSIDYTTALLTKGLETTREAPETMGTALKTIIARMRELSDYGETLEGDTDINNVEKQLAYVEIKLRDTNGELRSTEDVLDELGQKWDTLNKNQQAAVAKALAGTRQQSRLIAMMSDYERVTELQQISQRSAGATAAQAGVYLEGMEASLNKITVAWEKIVTSLTNADSIINTISFIGDFLDSVGNFLSTDWGVTATLGTILTLILQGVTAKINEVLYSKEEQRIEKENLKLQVKLARLTLEDRKAQVLKTKELREQAALRKKDAKIATAMADGRLTDAEQAAIEAEYNLEMDKAGLEAQEDLNKLQQEEIRLAYQEQQLGLSNADTAWNIASAVTMTAGMFGGLVDDSGAFMTILSVISGILQIIPTFIQIATLRQKQQNKELLEGAILSEANGLAKFWPWGVFAAAALLAIIGIGVAISKTAGQSSNAADEVNKLSNEIYKLNEKANAIKQITSAYDELDSKIIKTKKDQEELNSLLEQAADKLSTETYSSEKKAKKAGATYYGKNVSEQDYYNSLSTDQEKKEFLDSLEEETARQIKIRQQEQIQAVKKLSPTEKQKFFNENTTDNAIKQAQSAFYAINNSTLYNYIDSLTDASEAEKMALESVTQTVLSGLSAEQAYEYALDETGEKIKNLTKTLQDLDKVQREIDGRQTNISLVELLDSDDYGLKDKVHAYEEAAKALKHNKEAYDAFTSAYQEYEVFAQMEDDVVDFIDAMGWSIDQINAMGEGWKKLQKAGVDITEASYKKMYTDKILPTLEKTGGDVRSTIDAVFGTYLKQIKQDGEKYSDAYNSIVDIFAETMSIGISNMGQNIEKLGNSINSVYEKAAKWGELKESEKAAFMQDNAYLFEGDSGQEMLAAFESGNYRRIEEALRNNKGLQDQLMDQIKQIENELQIEENRQGDERNEAYIKYLKDWRDKLTSSTDIFQADLELLIEQEQKQLDIYREYLEKQQDELEDALEKRKEAYENYFDAINEQQDNADYEEERNRLITNISRLSTDITSAASRKQMAELEQQLEDLEKERQQTLRERAQEALIEALDKNVEEINEKFDKLLNNEGLLLQSMKSNLETNPNFLSDILYAAVQDGQMTALNAQQYARDVVAAFESTGANTDDIKEFMSSIQNNATFNLSNGQTVNLESDDAAMLWAAIQQILVKKGYGN